jgi:mono/diheme cytochrome c family protein
MSAVRFIIGTCLLMCAAVPCSYAKAQVLFLKQNWNDATRQLFYTTSQGSRMLPYDWFLALEVSDGQDSFLKARVPQLGYLSNSNTLANPDSLPVGFVADTDWSGRRYLGLNCAACHTNRIRLGGTTYQVDGAPALADMWGLVTGIQDSLNATATQEPKFARFAYSVLGAASTANEIMELRNDLNEFRAQWNQFVADSNPDPAGHLIWGRGRLDAFGMIFNRVSSIDLGIPANSNHPNAPVSYPFLWGTSWEDRVQWNASAPNQNDIERLGRNVGEVLGVFAAADLQKASILRPYYRTSARRLNQLRMENWLKTLWSPAWPKEFPPIETAKKEAGEKLFTAYCVRCHQVVAYGKQDTPVTVGRIPVGDVGTDSRMALNAIIRMAATGRLEGSRVPPGLDPLPARMPTGGLLVNIVQGAVISPFHDVDTRLHGLLSLKSILREANGASMELTHDEINDFMQEATIHSDADLMAKLVAYRTYIDNYNRQLVEFIDKATRDGVKGVNMDSNPYVYKARPLDGIWATAPYLHNGSVPNLYELLLPAEQRSKVFYAGSNEFDPVNVGFVTTAGTGTSKVDTQIEGNLNTGHDQYGDRDFTPEQRMQLLEYLKSL